jgi:hypothetical protein
MWKWFILLPDTWPDLPSGLTAVVNETNKRGEQSMFNGTFLDKKSTRQNRTLTSQTQTPLAQQAQVLTKSVVRD